MTNQTDEQAVLDALSPALWGLLRTGRFLTPGQEQQAKAWTALNVKTYGNIFATSCALMATLHPDQDSEELDKRARAYRFRLRRILVAGTLSGMREVVLDLARMAWLRAGVAESMPKMAGDSPDLRLSRTLYTALRYYAGSEADLSVSAGYTPSYIASLIRRAGGPSDDFLVALSHSSGVPLNWLMRGEGVPKPIS